MKNHTAKVQHYFEKTTIQSLNCVIYFIKNINKL